MLNDSSRSQLGELSGYWNKYNYAGKYGIGDRNAVEIEAIKLRSNPCSYTITGCSGGSATFFGYDADSLVIAYTKDEQLHFIEASQGEDGHLENYEIILEADLHHSYPKYLGDDPDQPLSSIPNSTHKQLHKDFRLFAPEMTAKRGYTGAQIQARFSPVQRINTYNFYSLYYPELLEDFENSVRYTERP